MIVCTDWNAYGRRKGFLHYRTGEHCVIKFFGVYDPHWQEASIYAVPDREQAADPTLREEVARLQAAHSKWRAKQKK